MFSPEGNNHHTSGEYNKFPVRQIDVQQFPNPIEPSSLSFRDLIGSIYRSDMTLKSLFLVVGTISLAEKIKGIITQ